MATTPTSRTGWRCAAGARAFAKGIATGIPKQTIESIERTRVVLKGPLGLTDDDIDHMRGLGYARSDEEALELVLSGAYDAAFFLRPTPVSQVQLVAATGINMPPKTTYFFPKIPTGLLLNPLL